MIRAVPTFALPRFLEDHKQKIDHAKALAKVVQEAGDDANVEEERKRHFATPVDGRALRGLPAIGRNVSGRIAGSDPVAALLAKQPRD